MIGVGLRRALTCRSSTQYGIRIPTTPIDSLSAGSSLRTYASIARTPILPVKPVWQPQRITGLPHQLNKLLSISSSRSYATHKVKVAPEHETFAERLRQAEAAEMNRVEQQEDWRIPESEAKPPKILEPILYLFVAGATAYTWAAWKTVKETKAIANGIREGSDVFGDFTSFLSARLSGDDKGASGGISEAQLRSARRHELAVRLGWRMQWLMGWCDQLYLPKGAKQAIGSAYLTVADWYLKLPEDKLVTVPVLACTTVVFLALNFSRTGAFGKNTFAFLRKNMMHIPAANRLHTMTTSVFSHLGIGHILFNSLALFSFGGAGLTAYTFLHDGNGYKLHTPEATTFYHFLAFFVTAGTFASVFSHIFTRILLQRANQAYGTEFAKRMTGRIPGLGASGAVYALVSVFAFAYPKEREMQIAFIPQLHAPAKDFLTTMISIETGFLVLSLVRARFIGFFDHAAHMGGALFGYLYFRYGNVIWESLKHEIYQQDEQFQTANYKIDKNKIQSVPVQQSRHGNPTRIV
ncbi:uncharacterized protein FA14DRAFT_162631 [Meira miltonrushii]|uniref:Peptidase S54 rhomboid domain-containing protein n=1 Tax=Meira miltonrushii TaxID=1280837 RepID=A0A316V8B4_9BASI|nr:uncharacterized protein FA14DRAFT_162631 [Meira miltonrushii]PWN31715.1 hypothetical protein FA14DRAFT_162631 [Meira miltonrushii]